MKIGLYDAGIGGITILNAIRQQLPFRDFIYLADNYNFPYHPKTKQQLDQIAQHNCAYLIKLGCDIVIIACNTSTVTSLSYVQEKFPQVSIIGTTPPIQRASQRTKNGHIAVLSTPKTQKSAHLKSTINKFASKLSVHNLLSAKLSLLIEEGEIDSSAIMHELIFCLTPVLEDSLVDVLALGCTHYPLVTPMIEKLLPRQIDIIDSSTEILEQVTKTLGTEVDQQNDKGKALFFTTGDPAKLNQVTEKIFAHHLDFNLAEWITILAA